MTTTTLTLQVIKAQENGQVSKSLSELLAQLVYQYAYRRLGKEQGEEMAADFLLNILPELERAALHYHYRGIPFEHYLNRMLSFRLLGFLRQQRQTDRDREMGEQLYAGPEQEQLYDCSAQEELSYQGCQVLRLLPEILQRKNSVGISACKKAFLLFALKYNYHLSETQQQAICQLIRFSHFLFCQLSAEVARMLEARLLARGRYRAKINLHRTRLLQVQQRQLRYGVGKEEHLTLQQDYHRRVITNFEGKLARGKMQPSHRQLAQLLHLSKGTVDSLLFRLKCDLIKLQSSAESGGSDATDFGQ